MLWLKWKETKVSLAQTQQNCISLGSLSKMGGRHFVLSVSIHFPLYWIGKWITAAEKSIYAWHVCSCLLTLNSSYCSQQKPTRVPQFEEWLRKRNRRIVSSQLCGMDGDYLHLKVKKGRKRNGMIIFWISGQGNHAFISVIYFKSPSIIVNNNLGNL